MACECAVQAAQLATAAPRPAPGAGPAPDGTAARCPDPGPPRGQVPPAPPPVWRSAMRGRCSPISPRSAAKGSTRAIMIPPGSRPRFGRAIRSPCPRRRPSASTSCRSDLALGHVRGKDRHRLACRRQGSRCRDASALLLDGALARRDIAARCTACCRPIRNMRAARGAGEDRQGRHRQDRSHPAQHGPLALAAARPRRQIYHRQRARFPRHPGRKRRQSLEAAGDRRRDQDPDAAADGAWRPASSSTRGGKCRRASRGSRGQEGLRPGQGRRRQGPALAPAAGADQRARPAEVRDVQSDRRSTFTTPTRAAASTASCARSATAASAPSTSSIWRSELLADDGGEWTAEKVEATLASEKTEQANFVKPLPVYIVYFSAAALNDGSIVDYKDIYSRDAKVIAALNDDGGPKRSRLQAATAARQVDRLLERHGTDRSTRPSSGYACGRTSLIGLRDSVGRFAARKLYARPRTSSLTPACRRRSCGRRRGA